MNRKDETTRSHRVILASGSPRRQALLADMGAPFGVDIADVDETPRPGERPAELAARLASAKAAAVAARRNSIRPDRYAGLCELVIGADTVVALGDEVLGKPVDDDQAAEMLTRLRARPHEVITAVCVRERRSGREAVAVNTTTVFMRNYSDAEIADYVASGDPKDKAGAYAIQHPVFAPAAGIDGCLSTVVGLPLGDVVDLLAEFGVSLPGDVVTVCEHQTHFRCCRRLGRDD